MFHDQIPKYYLTRKSYPSFLVPNRQQTYVQNRTRVAKVASYETSQETSVSCTQLVVLYAPFHFGSEYNFLGVVCQKKKGFKINPEQIIGCFEFGAIFERAVYWLQLSRDFFDRFHWFAVSPFKKAITRNSKRIARREEYLHKFSP